MNDGNSKIDFIQPLSFTLKKAKELIKKHRYEIKNLSNSFIYNQQIINHLKSNILFKDSEFDAHLFYNEKADISAKHDFLFILLEIEKNLSSQTFNTLKHWLDYRNNHIIEKYRDFFKWNKTTKKMERNTRKIAAFLSTASYSIMATNKKDMTAEQVLTHYRNKDLVEIPKLRDDILKNEIDGKRLRTHNDYTSKGKLFILFIALIIYSEILTIMNQKDLFKIFTVKELLYELKKIKRNNRNYSTLIKNKKDI